MKKIVALFLTLAMVFALAACGSKPADNQADSDKEPAKVQTDMEYVKEKGKLVVGITDFAPMDYKDDNGNWIGFDADMATAFAKKLGVEVEFIEIDWDYKIQELENKSIDVVWNGMTLVDEVKAGMECSNPYCNNAQIVIVPADKADKCKTIDDVKDFQYAVETKSAGQKQAEANGFSYTPVQYQSDALMEVASGTSDAAIIDLLMAAAMVGEGTSYEDLAYTVKLNSEEYGVGFRKGSDLAAELNQFFKDSYADGSMMTIAEKYGVQASIIEQK